MIYFTKTPEKNITYRVFDPWRTVNSTFAKKFFTYGFIDKEITERYIKDIEDQEIKFALAGNRIGLPEYHINIIKEELKSGNDVWIDLNLLEYFMEYLDEFEGEEITIEDGYNREKAHEFFIHQKSLEMLLGIYAKFYWKLLSKEDGRFIGWIQDSAKSRKITEDEMERLIEIVEMTNPIILKENELPTINFPVKLLETLLHINKDPYEKTF